MRLELKRRVVCSCLVCCFNNTSVAVVHPSTSMFMLSLSRVWYSQTSCTQTFYLGKNNIMAKHTTRKCHLPHVSDTSREGSGGKYFIYNVHIYTRYFIKYKIILLNLGIHQFSVLQNAKICV